VVAQFLRLKLSLLGNSFRRSPWHIIGLVLALVYGLGTALFVVAGLATLRTADIELAKSAVVVLGAVILIVSTILPLTLGIDDTLDPRTFSLYGIPTSRLARNLAIAALLGVPGLVITIMAFGQVITWSRDPLSVLFALIAVPLIVVTATLSARISTSIAAFVYATRKARDLSGLVGIVALVSLSPVIILLAGVDWGSVGLRVLGEVAEVVQVTPLGAAWAIPAHVAAGDTPATFLAVLIALAWIGVLFAVWRALVAATLVTPIRQAQARTYVGLGWFEFFPRTPTGAIAARSLTYWSRDARYSTSLLVIPLIPIFMIVTFVIAGMNLQALALLPVPVMCLFLSWSIHNDVAFDNTALWLHLSTSTSGSADRWGRVIPVLLVGVPLILIGSLVSAWIFGDLIVAASLAGVSVSILFAGLGLSSITSARFPYPAVRPGDSPFAQPAGSSSPAGPIQAVSFFAIIALSFPALTFAVLGLLYGGIWHYASLATGLALGLVALFGGLAIGSRVYDRRTSELLEFLLQN
jgi:ABC-2 type transport system permease protein